MIGQKRGYFCISHNTTPRRTRGFLCFSNRIVSLKNQRYSNLFKLIHNTIKFYFTDGEYCLSFGFYMQGTSVSIGLHYSGYGSVWHRSNPPGNFWSIVSISLRANQGTVLVRKNNPLFEKWKQQKFDKRAEILNNLPLKKEKHTTFWLWDTLCTNHNLWGKFYFL